MSLTTPANQTAELERYAAHVDLQERRDQAYLGGPGWAARWLEAVPNVSAAQSELANKFLAELKNAETQSAWQQVEQLQRRVFHATVESGDDSMQIWPFADLLPLEALSEKPERIGVAFKSLRGVMQERLLPMLEASMNMVNTDLADDDYALLTSMFDATTEIVAAVKQLIGGDFKTYADADVYAERLGNAERTIADAYDELPIETVNRRKGKLLTRESTPQLRLLLISAKKFTMQDAIVHSEVDGKGDVRGGIGGVIVGLFGSTIASYLTYFLHALYSTLMVLDQLYFVYTNNRDTLERANAAFGLMESYTAEGVDPTVRHTLGWIKLEDRTAAFGYKYTVKIPQEPGFITARQTFYATLYGYPREIIGVGGVLVVLVIALTVLGFIRYRVRIGDYAVRAISALSGAAQRGVRSITGGGPEEMGGRKATVRTVRGLSPPARIQAPPPELPEPPKPELTTPRTRGAGASRGATPPRTVGRAKRTVDPSMN